MTSVVSIRCWVCHRSWPKDEAETITIRNQLKHVCKKGTGCNAPPEPICKDCKKNLKDEDGPCYCDGGASRLCLSCYNIRVGYTPNDRFQTINHLGCNECEMPFDLAKGFIWLDVPNNRLVCNNCKRKMSDEPEMRS